LFKIAIQGISLWHFHVYMYYNLNWFIPSIFLLSILVPFLWWFQQVQKICIYSCIENTSVIFTFSTRFNFSMWLSSRLKIIHWKHCLCSTSL
jgi:hypothetical protein